MNALNPFWSNRGAANAIPSRIRGLVPNTERAPRHYGNRLSEDLVGSHIVALSLLGCFREVAYSRRDVGAVILNRCCILFRHIG